MSLKTKMSQCLGKAATRAIGNTAHYGIELEYENNVTKRDNLKWWTATHDGSLRDNGVEFVSKPLSRAQVKTALDEARAMVKKSNLIATERCGLHVHVNMHPYTFGQFFSLVTLYALVETSVFATYAEGRDDSSFAVPLYDNNTLVRHLANDCNYIRQQTKSGKLRRMYAQQASKYSAINTCSLGTFGTLEFRQPYCTRQFKAIKGWIEFIQRLEDTAIEYSDPLQVLDAYETNGLGALQEQLFGTTIKVDDELQEAGVDAATFIAGYEPPAWQELNWDQAI